MKQSYSSDLGSKPKTSIAVGAYTVGRKAGKAKGKTQQGAVLQRGMQYREKKPTILAYSGRRGKK